MSGDKGISAFPKGDNLLTWIATVTGPDDSVYQGLKYKLRLDFPAGRAQHKQPPQRRSLTAVVKSGGIQENTAGK